MIKFPRMHIAASVQNRILNMMSAVETQTAAMEARHVPQDVPTGKALDAALATPPQPMAAPSDAEAAATLGAVQGSAMDALTASAIVDELE